MTDKLNQYQTLLQGLTAALEGETDEIAVLATVACEVFHAFDAFHWVGFYRVTADELLTVGPYQGGHGCLRIPFSKGVCGAAARTQTTQNIADVNAIAEHIACSSSTQSELVVPLFDGNGKVVAVFDIDSDHLNQFDEVDETQIQAICNLVENTVYG